MNNQALLDELLELLSTVNRINRGLLRGECPGPLGNLSAIQLQTVITVRRYGVLNMSELAGHLLVTRPQLTKVTGSLEEMGLLARRHNPESRREVLIELTGQGKRFIEESLLGESGFLARVLDALGPEEAEELRRAMSTMRRIFAGAAGD